jgi:hypothetical protein
VESSFKILPLNVVISSNSTNLTWINFAKKRYKNRLTMLRITADRFSEIRAPEWIFPEEEEARTTLKEIAKNRSIVAEFASAEADSGFAVSPLNPSLTSLPKTLNYPLVYGCRCECH